MNVGSCLCIGVEAIDVGAAGVIDQVWFLGIDEVAQLGVSVARRVSWRYALTCRMTPLDSRDRYLERIELSVGVNKRFRFTDPDAVR